MAPRIRFLILFGSRKNQPRYTCLSEAKASQGKEYGLRFHLLLHTSYTMGFLSAPLIGDVFSGYFVITGIIKTL
jgi:hypothetical protein